MLGTSLRSLQDNLEAINKDGSKKMLFFCGKPPFGTLEKTQIKNMSPPHRQLHPIFISEFFSTIELGMFAINLPSKS